MTAYAVVRNLRLLFLGSYHLRWLLTEGRKGSAFTIRKGQCPLTRLVGYTQTVAFLIKKSSVVVHVPAEALRPPNGENGSRRGAQPAVAFCGQLPPSVALDRGS